MAALRRLGYPRQFHWAWAFLSSLVYVIGRSVVVKRQAGHGAAPMWVAIALSVAMFVGMFVWISAMAVNLVNEMMLTSPGI